MFSRTFVFKFSAIYLAWLSLAFFLVIENMLTGNALFDPDCAFGAILMHESLAIDYEAQFAVIFLIWAVYIWYASTDIVKHRIFLSFSGLAFFCLGLTLVALAYVDGMAMTQLLRESVAWIVLGAWQLFVIHAYE